VRWLIAAPLPEVDHPGANGDRGGLVDQDGRPGGCSRACRAAGRSCAAAPGRLHTKLPSLTLALQGCSQALLDVLNQAVPVRLVCLVASLRWDALVHWSSSRPSRRCLAGLESVRRPADQPEPLAEPT
jgi:hypothetical protein